MARLAAHPSREYRRKLNNRSQNAERNAQVYVGRVAISSGQVNFNDSSGEMRDRHGNVLLAGMPENREIIEQTLRLAKKGRDAKRQRTADDSEPASLSAEHGASPSAASTSSSDTSTQTRGRVPARRRPRPSRKRTPPAAAIPETETTPQPNTMQTTATGEPAVVPVIEAQVCRPLGLTPTETALSCTTIASTASTASTDSTASSDNDSKVSIMTPAASIQFDVPDVGLGGVDAAGLFAMGAVFDTTPVPFMPFSMNASLFPTDNDSAGCDFGPFTASAANQMFSMQPVFPLGPPAADDLLPSSSSLLQASQGLPAVPAVTVNDPMWAPGMSLQQSLAATGAAGGAGCA